MTTATVCETSTMTGTWEALVKAVATIEDVCNWCGIGKMAYSVIEKLKFYLKTREDITNFILKFEDKFLWQDNFGGLAYMSLAREVGGYHYEYSNYEQLEKMDIKSALERLYNQPLNGVWMDAFKASNATLRELYDLKQANPRQHFMSSLNRF